MAKDQVHQPVRVETPPGGGDVAAVDMRDIVKRYSGVLANDHISFEVRGGEIHALLGENGAGKSTLMSILYGLVKPDGGEIRVDGQRVTVGSPKDAIQLGIGMVHQHFKLVPTLSAAENFTLGEHGRLTRQRLKETTQRIDSVAAEYGLEVRPAIPVWQLSVGEQQRVEIVRALYHGAKILLLDEPTATLAPPEVDALLEQLQRLRDGGSAVVLVTHHLEEVLSSADRITVLRAGRHVGTVPRRDASIDSLVQMMVGENEGLERLVERLETTDTIASRNNRPTGAPQQDLLTVYGMRVRNDRGQLALDEVSFKVGRGEIVAIAGVEGNGQAELEEALLGLREMDVGRILLNGRDLTGRATAERLAAGMALIPSDRYRRGLIGSLPVVENLVLDRFRRPPIGGTFWLHRKAILTQGVELLRRFAVRLAHPTQRAASLSGGNAQRVVLARALSAAYSLLVCGQPTRGLDVRATRDVMAQLASVRDSGSGVLLISTDLREVFALSDRCLVIYKGRIIAQFDRSHLDYQTVGAALGGVPPPVDEGAGGVSLGPTNGRT